MKEYVSWNRLPRLSPDQVLSLSNSVEALPAGLAGPLIAYGNGRSYGDVCLTDSGTLLLTRGMDRFVEFNSRTGVLCCEAGITLAEILALVVPQGWFLPCTPGTRFVTIGGAVANDVHGKNHHEVGSFGNNVISLDLLRSDGSVIKCGPCEQRRWFEATVGGLGLTGLIRRVEIQLVPISNPWMWVQSRRFGNLEGFWDLSEKAEKVSPYTVAWVDCLASGKDRGRGIFLSAQHASHQGNPPSYTEGRKRVPFDPPVSLVNGFTLRLFNSLYYRQTVKPEGFLSHYVPYFYPLDGIEDWNRIYGRKGFYQYQCVIPPRDSKEATSALLNVISKHAQGSFLAVLKRFGNTPSLGMLSFPRPGDTLALDFPNRGETTLNLFKDLDAIVRESGGALYPAKDARMPADLFRSGFPEWESFAEYVDPNFSSSFWRRVTK